MKRYTVSTTENLRNLCIENSWFTCGSTEQYEKLFYANEHNATIEEITTIIWLCSDDKKWCRRDILFALKEARVKFWQPFFNIQEPSWTYTFYNRYGECIECTFSVFCDRLYNKLSWDIDYMYKVELMGEMIWYYTQWTEGIYPDTFDEPLYSLTPEEQARYKHFIIFKCPGKPNEKGEYIGKTPIFEQASRVIEAARTAGKLYGLKGVLPDGKEILIL